MEQATYQTEKDSNYARELEKRRVFLASQFQSIPTYGTAEFWNRIEESQVKLVGLASPSFSQVRAYGSNSRG